MSDQLFPEHEKLKALDGKNDVVGDFIEWLRSQGYIICSWQSFTAMRQPYTQEVYEAALRDEEPPEYIEYQMEPELAPVGKSVQTWLAEYFGIDQQKLAEEKQQILDKIWQAMEKQVKDLEKKPITHKPKGQ